MRKKEAVFFPMLIAYTAVIFIIRTTFIIIDRTGLPEPKVVVGGLHLHHYFFGIGTLFLVAILAIHQKFSRRLLALTLGISLALIIDEFQFLVRLSEVQYPTKEFDTIGFVGILLIAFSIIERFNFSKSKLAKKNLVNFPKISVVIPAYNEEKSIAKTLRSLQRQNYKGKWETFVVDNGSTDKTAQIARRHGARVIFEPRKGVAFARQKGFEKATGEIIATTDSDSIVPANWLTTFARQFDHDPNLAVVSGMYDFYNGSLLLKTLTYLCNYRMFSLFGWYSGANMAVKKEAFLKVGGFDTSIRLSEDSDLCQRLQKIGKVKRLACFKVKTSARRFNQLGLIGGLWDYSTNYLKFKLNIPAEKISFKAGSEVKEAKLAKLFVYSFGVLIFILAFIMIPINPVHAKVNRVRKNFNHQVALTVKKGTGFITEEISDASQETQKVTHHFHHVRR